MKYFIIILMIAWLVWSVVKLVQAIIVKKRAKKCDKKICIRDEENNDNK